jgi:hypothetical protein
MYVFVYVCCVYMYVYVVCWRLLACAMISEYCIYVCIRVCMLCVYLCVYGLLEVVGLCDDLRILSIFKYVCMHVYIIDVGT